MDNCVICGLPEDEHHTFERVNRPSASCCCDAGEWANPGAIPEVCGQYIGNGTQNCSTCEHDKECHGDPR